MSPDPNFLDPERFDRYLTGASSAAERAEMDALLATLPELRTFAEASRVSVDGDGLWARFTTSSWYPGVQPQRSSGPSRARATLDRRETSWPISRQSSGWRRFRYAARVAIAGVMLFAAAVYTRGNRIAESGEYSTQRGERLNVTLPDGSSVVLGPQTILKYSVTGNGASEIAMTGQAYFTVPASASHPFVVHSAGVTTKVLGTAFEVRHYPDEESVQVAVVSGKVSSGTRAETRILTPGMVAMFKDSVVQVATDSILPLGLSWTAGRLVFTEVPVGSVLKTLQRWYDYEFKLADTSLAATPVTARFIVDDPEHTLVALKALLDVTLTAQGRVITLHPKGASSRTGTPIIGPVVETVFRSTEAGK